MNKKHVKILAISLVVAFVLLFVRIYNGPTSANKIFERDYSEIIQVVGYLNSLEDISDASIDSADGTMTLRFGDTMEITDKNVTKVISSLFRKGYDEIVKDEDTTIYFVRWRDFFGCHKGFAFSTDGTGELDIQFVTEQRPLSETDWYYYVSDYEEWRVQN